MGVRDVKAAVVKCSRVRILLLSEKVSGRDSVRTQMGRDIRDSGTGAGSSTRLLERSRDRDAGTGGASTSTVTDLLAGIDAPCCLFGNTIHTRAGGKNVIYPHKAVTFRATDDTSVEGDAQHSNQPIS